MQKRPVSDVQAHLEELKAEHAKLEMRLRELERHLSLSPDEQLERVRLKKAKLQLKDELQRWTQQRA
jgi:uncharacterized protein YdcH (DUF465 family)